MTVALPDVLCFGLRIVFCGTAVGAASARRGAYYAGPGNAFWRTLFEIGLTPDLWEPVKYCDAVLLGVGFTDLAKNISGSDSILQVSDFDRDGFAQKILKFQPRVVAFTSKRAAQEFLLRKVDYGLLPDVIGRSKVFVLPSPSGMARRYWDLGHWHTLARLASSSSTQNDAYILKAATAGTYSPHCFYIRADSLADIDPDDDYPTHRAAEIHAHEYVHYLHNVSTCAGLHLFVANLWLLRSLPEFTDEYGHVVAQASSPTAELWVSTAQRWIVALRGEAQWEDLSLAEAADSWQFGAIRNEACLLEWGEQSHRVEFAAVDATAFDNRGRQTSGSVSIGYDLITEGVAYEVEREIRRANGTPIFDLDVGVPAWPYLFYGALIDHLVGRATSSVERLELGVCALLTSSPGAELVRLGELLSRVNGAESTELDPPILGVVRPILDHGLELVETTLKPEVTALGEGTQLHEAGLSLYAIFRAGFALRTINPVIERTLVRPLDGPGFRQIAGTLLDCVVIQEKFGAKPRISWVGPGIIGVDPEDNAQIARLQTAMHFAQRHLLKSGKLQATSELRPVRCPYSGACLTEIRDSHPEECQTRPWTRFMGAKPGDEVCWYAAGVKSFVRYIKIESGQ